MSTQHFDEIIPAGYDSLPRNDVDEADYPDYNDLDSLAGNELYPADYSDYDGFGEVMCFDMNQKIVPSGPDIPSCNIGDVNIAGKPRNIHLGTKLILNGPITVPDTNEDKIVEITEVDNFKNEKIEQMNVEDTHTRINRLNFGIDFIKKKGSFLLNRYLQVLLIFILIEIIITAVFILFSGDDKLQSEDIKGLKLKDIGKNLQRFNAREKWGANSQCSIQCPLLKKTRIKIVSPKSILFRCTFISDEKCDNLISEESKIFSTPQYKDIYYNYIVGIDGNIFEARPLTCAFDDEPLIKDKQYYLETLVIGMGYCFKGRSVANKYKTDKELETLNSLLTNLESNGILAKELTFDFHSDCRGSLLVDKIEGAKRYGGVSFYNDDFTEVTKVISPVKTDTMLFLDIKDDNTPKDDINREYLLKLKNDNTNECANETTLSNISDKITVRFIFPEQLNITKLDTCSGSTCESIFRDHTNSIRNNLITANYKINYFVSLGNPNAIFNLYPVNCSVDPSNNNILVNIILHVHPDVDKEVEKYFEKMSEIVRSIKRDIEISPDKINIQFVCPLQSQTRYSITLYDFITDVGYVEDKFGKINPISTCQKSPNFLLEKGEPK